MNDLSPRRVSALALMCALALGLLSFTVSPSLRAQPEARPARLEWDAERRFLYASFNYRDAVDASIRRKLSRGLPITIVMTAALYRALDADPVATTAQTCKVTWHVWEEAYRVELTRPEVSQTRWTTTIEGVLRRCAEAKALLVAHQSQVVSGIAVFLQGKVQINPVSPLVLQKIKRWVSRPTGTSTAAPGDALFSTFTGLFLQRIGDAERELKFATPLTVPAVREPAPARDAG